MTNDPHRKMVAEFQKTFETPEELSFWISLVEEESNELKEAAANLLKEAVDFTYVIAGALNVGTREELLAKVVLPNEFVRDLFDAIPDHVFEAAFERVHANNMSKVHADGTVRRREDGKVLKPADYVPVDLSDLVR